mmetsp:Transcript_161491/g.513166  ORF Transcript_161491/g.513166 Transcript_161491/m.513166 type:complete len:318 (+) Transcript_161491:957-1910(+)
MRLPPARRILVWSLHGRLLDCQFLKATRLWAPGKAAFQLSLAHANLPEDVLQGLEHTNQVAAEDHIWEDRQWSLQAQADLAGSGTQGLGVALEQVVDKAIGLEVRDGLAQGRVALRELCRGADAADPKGVGERLRQVQAIRKRRLEERRDVCELTALLVEELLQPGHVRNLQPLQQLPSRIAEVRALLDPKDLQSELSVGRRGHAGSPAHELAASLQLLGVQSPGLLAQSLLQRLRQLRRPLARASCPHGRRLRQEDERLGFGEVDTLDAVHPMCHEDIFLDARPIEDRCRSLHTAKAAQNLHFQGPGRCEGLEVVL